MFVIGYLCPPASYASTRCNLLLEHPARRALARSAAHRSAARVPSHACRGAARQQRQAGIEGLGPIGQQFMPILRCVFFLLSAREGLLRQQRHWNRDDKTKLHEQLDPNKVEVPADGPPRAVPHRRRCGRPSASSARTRALPQAGAVRLLRCRAAATTTHAARWGRPGFKRMRELSRCARVARGAPTDTRFMRRAGSTRTRTRCRRTSRTATAAASTRRGSARLLLRASRRVHGCVAETSRSVRRLWPMRAPAAGLVHVPMAMHRACMRMHTHARARASARSARTRERRQVRATRRGRGLSSTRAGGRRR